MHLGFTNIGSERLHFRVIAIWNPKFWFGSPCFVLDFVEFPTSQSDHCASEDGACVMCVRRDSFSCEFPNTLCCLWLYDMSQEVMMVFFLRQKACHWLNWSYPTFDCGLVVKIAFFAFWQNAKTSIHICKITQFCWARNNKKEKRNIDKKYLFVGNVPIPFSKVKSGQQWKCTIIFTDW